MSIRKRAEKIFIDLLDLPRDEWPRRMATACGEDSALHRELKAIVAADTRGWSPSPPNLQGDRPGIGIPTVGSMVGPYRLMEEIARGGFGVVFHARQESPIQRDVAVKVIKLGLDTEEVIRRFDIERKVLALLDHPHIAKVYDAGATPEGRPYFVMEYVRGEPIHGYCDRHSLSIEARLELMVQIAQAIQHAHQKGIIHRDLKPGNILVAEHDGRPFVKVIDFGIAKATDRKQLENTAFTSHGSPMGTLEYMSPEQAEGSADIDTRTDIYSLGVLLYELLTGVTPFDPKELRNAAYAEMQRIIREVEPPRPSTRLAQSSTTIASVAACRHIEPHRLGTIIRGDLDWITLKALEKDRTRRYESASALAMDILRHLRHEPVAAGHPGAVYRMRKFVRRNRVAVISATLVVVALVAGIIGTTMESIRATRARNDADRNAQQARDAERVARVAEASALRQVYSANMLSASDEIERGQVDAARHYMESTSKALRGWEWRHLANRLDLTERIHERSRSGLPQILPLPDGRSYCEVGPNPKDGICLYDVETGRLLSTIPTHEPCWKSWLVAGGRQVATRIGDTASSATTLELWDLGSGKCLGSAQAGSIFFDVAGDGSRMASVREGQIHVVDLATGLTRVCTMVEPPNTQGQLPLLRFQPDGKRLAACTSLGTIALYDTDSLEYVSSIGGHDNAISVLAFSDDSRFLATGSLDRTIRITDVASDPPIPVTTLRGHTGFVNELCFSPNGELLASYGADWTIRLWHARTGDLHGLFRSDGGGLCFLPGGQMFATGEAGGVRFWSTHAADVWVFRGHCSYVYAVMLSPDGATTYSGGWDGFTGRPGSLRIWDTATGDQIAAIGATDSYVRTAALSADGARLAVSLVSGIYPHIDILDTATGAPVTSVTDMTPGEADSLAFDPSGRFVVWSAKSCESLCVSDLRTGETRRPPVRLSGGGHSCVAWSPDGTTIAVVQGDEPMIILLDAQSLEIVRQWPHFHRRPGHRLVFSPDSQRILTVADDGIVRVWDVATGKALGDLVGHSNRVYCAAYSPDGKRIASGGDDNNIRIWDAETFEPVARLSGHEAYIFSLAWRADSQQLISGSGDHDVRVWDTGTLGDRMQARRERQAIFAEVEPMVRRLFAELGDAAKVVEAVKADASLTARARQVALQTVLRISIERRAQPLSYPCERASGPIVVDGAMDEPAWQGAAWTSAFVDIEGARRPEPRFRTRAKMLWDDEFFYIAAELEEPHVSATLTRHDEIVFQDNDFEVFIDPDGDMQNYYEVELNAMNTLFDLLLVRAYRAGGPAWQTWNLAGFQSAVRVDGTLNDPRDVDGGWTVEMALPWSSLAEYTRRPSPPQPGDMWRVNFSRVEWRYDIVDGRYRKFPKLPEDNWVWTPQHEINMHAPEHWGFVEFAGERE